MDHTHILLTDLGSYRGPPLLCVQLGARSSPNPSPVVVPLDFHLSILAATDHPCPPPRIHYKSQPLHRPRNRSQLSVVMKTGMNSHYSNHLLMGCSRCQACIMMRAWLPSSPDPKHICSITYSFI